MRARQAAWDALRAVHSRDSYANLVLPALLRRRGLVGADAARATDLTYGTLRGQGTYDRIIDACATRPLPSVDPEVLDALRLGCYQLLGARVPAHAAVATTVDLVRRRRGPGAARFTNAVLRHVADTDLDGWADRLVPEDHDPRERLAVRHLHPRWVVDAFAEALPDRARLATVLACDNEPPRVTLAAIPGRSTVDELVDAGGTPGRWASTALVLAGGDPGAVPAVAGGRARVQDEGSQLVTAVLADAEADDQDGTWADVCAGPGGKALLLGGWASLRAARLVAGDRRHHRAVLVRRSVDRAALSDVVGVVQADATTPAWRDASCVRVLVDAPCTGLGALRRRPEARWRRQPGDLDRLVPGQVALLRRALGTAAVGGLVGYVTCSPHRAETVEVVDAVVAGRADVRVEDVPALVPQVPDAGRGPYLQLWPDLHGTDAMFLALLRRLR